MRNTYFVLLLMLVFCAGCRFLQISDQEIEQIATETATAVQAITTVATAPVIPAGAGAGVGAVAGLVIAYLVRIGLKAVQKKPTP